MKNYIFIFSIIFLQLGCQNLPRHSHHVGDVSSVTSDNEIVVCLDGKNYKVGETVEFYRSNCQRKLQQKRWNSVSAVECLDQKIGEGVVIFNSDSHSVKFKNIGNSKIFVGDYIKL